MIVDNIAKRLPMINTGVTWHPSPAINTGRSNLPYFSSRR